MDSDIEIVENPKLAKKSDPKPTKKSSPKSGKKSNKEEVKLPAKRSRDFEEETGDEPEEIINVMLAKNYTKQDPAGYWISEKLDGMRCYWNGKSFKTRTGHPLDVPDFFIEGLPRTVSLDGELWVGRKAFQECISICRCLNNGKNDMSRWNKVKFMLFDAPSLNLPFEKRLDYLKEFAKSTTNRFVEVLEQRKCTGKKDMEKELAKVEALGGEGVMLREAGSFYERKRSGTLLKVKTFQDAEAIVIGHEQGKGKYSGMFGALRVRMDNGKEFKIGSGFTDLERDHPPDIGSTVTYKFQELTNDGIPRFPTYLRKHTGS